MPFIYFIHEDKDYSQFKVGKTENHPADRMEQLQTGNPRKLRIYRWLQIADHSTAETYLHTKWADKHIRGEWYSVDIGQIDEECAIISSIDADVAVSGQWEIYDDESRLKVRLDRYKKGKYKGQRHPRAAQQLRGGFIERNEITKIINKF